jgi:hypothetical protein
VPYLRFLQASAKEELEMEISSTDIEGRRLLMKKEEVRGGEVFSLENFG